MIYLVGFARYSNGSLERDYAEAVGEARIGSYSSLVCLPCVIKHGDMTLTTKYHHIKLIHAIHFGKPHGKMDLILTIKLKTSCMALCEWRVDTGRYALTGDSGGQNPRKKNMGKPNRS